MDSLHNNFYEQDCNYFRGQAGEVEEEVDMQREGKKFLGKRKLSHNRHAKLYSKSLTSSFFLLCGNVMNPVFCQ